MSKKILSITINYPNGLITRDLNARHILVDTIKSRGLGEVIDEGSGDDFMDLCVEIEDSDAVKSEITAIVESLGLRSFSTFSMQDMDENW